MKKKSKDPKKDKFKHLLYKSASAWAGLKKGELQEIWEHAEGYKRFLSRAKTERECVAAIESELKKQKFHLLADRTKLQPGDRVYKIVKGRALVAAVVGNPQKSWRLVGAHVDSPRLDLKPNPLLQDGELALLQSHYYGGIKKYQWVNVPLSLHAVVHTRRGTQSFVVGEKAHEPRFMIPDMPPHLARDQMAKTAKDLVSGEQLQILVGNRPLEQGAEAERVKLAVLQHLFDKYGIVEKDLLSADISLVPAGEPLDLGFDGSMIAAYGQDDRACSYAALQAIARLDRPAGVALAMFVDKEEIGSEGDTGAQSRILENFTAEMQRKLNLRETPAEILERATAISADVTEALNPNFKEISDARNTSLLGHGISIEKYGGGGGKYSTNEASSEYMTWLVRLLESEKVCWQTGELGRLDLGGGGTIAMYLSRHGLDAIDAGPPLLSMHSTQEISSKVDIYHTFLAYRVFMGA